MININDGFEGIRTELAEVDYLEQLYTNYGGDVYLSTAISEVADKFSDDLTSDEMLANIYSLDDEMREVIEYGLIDMKYFSIDKLFKIAFFHYMYKLINENLAIILSNYLANYVNNNKELFADIDVNDIENAITDITDDITNKTYDYYETVLREKLGL